MRFRLTSGRNLMALGRPLTALMLCVVAATLFGTSAGAMDMRVLVEALERVEFDDNITVDPDSSDEVYGSTTTLNLDVAAESQESTLRLRGGAKLSEFGGAGATNDLDSLDPNVKGDLLIKLPTSTLGFSGSFSRRSTAFNEFDSNSASGETDRLSYSAGAHITVDVDRANSLTGAVTYSMVDFADSVIGLDPNESVLIAGSWTRNIDQDTDVTLRGSILLFDADSPQDTESESISLSARVTNEATPSLIVYGEAGVSIVDTEEVNAGVRQSDSFVGGNFNFGLTYLIGLTSFTASVSQSVQPSDEGELRQRTSFNTSMVHRINTVSTFSMGGFVGFEDSTSSGPIITAPDRTFASGYTHYAIQLSRFWNFLLGYEVRVEDENNGTGVSNKVFGTLSREFVLLP